MSNKQELKAPDPFLQFTIKLWDRVAEKRKEIGIGLVVLLVAAAVFAGVDAHQRNVRDAAGAALAKALHVAERPVKGEDDDEEKPETPPAPDDAPFKSDAEKQQALAKALQDVIAQHGGSEAARDALVPLGDAQLKLGQLDDAARSYSGFIAAAGDDLQLRSLAELGLARVAEQKKDYPGALAAYETLQRDAPHTFLKDRAALGKARMLEAAGKKQEAAEAFQDVKDGYANTDAARDATDRLAMLAAAGVKPAPRAAPSAPDAGGMVLNLNPPKAE